jgi:V/A-type H+-transporting ATPase subunit C
MITRGLHYAEPSSRLRVRLGRLLAARDYASLVRAPSLEQMLAELGTTNYARAATIVATATTSFADALRQDYLGSAERAIRLFPRPARRLCRAFLVRFTIDSLKVILRTAGSRLARPRLSALLGPLTDPALPLERLIGAVTVQEVVEALSETPYGEALRTSARRAAPSEARSSAPLFETELTLERWFFDRLWLAARNLPAADSPGALRLVGTLADVTNVLWAERLRDAFAFSPEDIRRHLLPYGFHLTDRKRRALALRAATGPLPLPFSAGSAEGRELHLRLARWLCREASRPLFMFPFQASLPLAYLLLAEMEVCDLVTLYEGKRWSVPAETLARRLIRFHGEEVLQ